MSTRHYVRASARRRFIVIASVLLSAWLPQQGGAQTIQPGTLPGGFSVSPGGAATYQIPVQVPPGVAGMEPRLGIGYSSQGGLGLAGTGWDLGGLSSITRCPRTKEVDDVRGAVNFDMNDRFCLDGQRLARVSGDYGAPGSEYRTRMETFSRITALGTAGNGPASFIVETKAGLKMEYGATEDSRIEAHGKSAVRAWALNKVTDSRGNVMSVTYVEDASKHWFLPGLIDYSGNRVELEYEALYNPRFGYQAGSATRQSHRVVQITTSAGGVGVHRYRFRYRANSNLLEEVKLCVPDLTTCLPSTTFAYKLPTPLMNGGGSQLTGSIDKIGTQGINGQTGVLHFGDWNGDGFTDAMWFDPVTGITRWFRNDGPDADGQLSFGQPPQTVISQQQLEGQGSATLHFGDWNGDGLTDVMWWDRITGANRWFVNKGNFVFEQSTDPVPRDEMRQVTAESAIHFGDWNGDGMTDVMRHEPMNGTNRWYINNGSLTFQRITNPIATSLMNSSDTIPGQLHFADWNGDGIADVMWYDPRPGTNRLFINNGYLGFTQSSPIVPAAINGGDEASFYIGDWNGDGLPDILWYHRDAGLNRWFLNYGDGRFGQFGSATESPIAAAALNRHSAALPAIVVADLNGDGISDLFWRDPTTGTNRSFVNNGNLQFQKFDNTIGPGGINADATATMQGGDFNGDGITDLVWFYPSLGLNRWFVSPEGRDAFPTTITSNGNTIQLTLSSLTNQGVYSRDPIAGYPRVSLQIPQYAVVQVSQSDGIGGAVATQYTYTGMNAELGTGRGFLGMRKIRAINLQTKIATITEFRQDWPFIGMVASVETHNTDSTNGGLKRVRNTYDSTAGSSGASLFVYTLRTVEDSWDLNGVAFPTITTTYQYGSTPQYGDVTRIEVTNSDGSSKVTTNEYQAPDTAPGKWILGRLTKAIVTSSRP